MFDTAIVNEDYTILALDEDLCVVEHDSPDICIDQFEGEKLEVWKEREDGFLFVYCNRLEVGYWVIPSHITITQK